MSSLALIAALRPVVEVLSRLDIPYYVGGSVASSVHGAARTTLDVDVVADLPMDVVTDFVAALESGFYVSKPMVESAIGDRSCFNLIHLATSYKVDVFVTRQREFDRTAMQRRVTEQISEAESFETWVATPEDIILSKLEWFRIGGEVSERQWLDVLNVLKVQRSTVDVEYLVYWARELQVSDLLVKVLDESGLSGHE